MEDFYSQLKELKELVAKELKKINQKGDMTPAELENATKAVCLLEKIQKMEDGGMYDEGYSEHGWYPQMYYDGTGGGSYNRSYARGGNPMTGRYTSRDGSYNMSRSGHSIKDRMIDRLEAMMDDAKTEYERQQIMEEIANLRG